MCWRQDFQEDCIILSAGVQRIFQRGSSSPIPSGNILIQAFLSQEKDVTPDKNLLAKVQDAALWLETLSDTKPAKPSLSTTSSIADFFLALTICNSVMVSTTTETRQRVRTTDSGWWDGWEMGQGVKP